MGPTFSFRLEREDGTARSGVIETPHGVALTPVFMPVGTAAAMKAMTPADLERAGASFVLSNAYHLALAPGEALVKRAGGLHAFMGWKGPMLTDSGGFQVFSLPNRRVDEDGVEFRHEADGTVLSLSPERSMAMQQDLGADVAMCLDECVPYPCEGGPAREAMGRTLRWARRCRAAHSRGDQALFGIVQGSTYPELREACARGLREMDFPGYAVGGVSVGEGRPEMARVLDLTVGHLPADRPRYLMGVGLPEDVLEGVERGIDMFDCVIPTRYARSATAFTFFGKHRLTAGRFRKDLYPLDTRCPCYGCQGFSRAYLHHLFKSNEILGAMLLAVHNVTFYQTLMRRAREAILEGGFRRWKEAFLAEYLRGPS